MTDGYYYACIALSQSVAEAIARFMCERSGWKPSNDFRTNIKNLADRKIEPLVSSFLKEVWGKDRNDFHHLNKNVPTELARLKEIAGAKMDALNKAEAEIFAYTVIDGKLQAKYEGYWDKKNDYLNAYLRLE